MHDDRRLLDLDVSSKKQLSCKLIIMSHREASQNLLSLKGILHSDEGHVGDEPNFRSLRDGRRYITARDADGIRDVTFVGFPQLDATREEKLANLAADLVEPTKEASPVSSTSPPSPSS